MPIDPREPKPQTKIFVEVIPNNRLNVWVTDVAHWVRAKSDADKFGIFVMEFSANTDSSMKLTVAVNPCYSFKSVALWMARGGVLVNSDGANLKVNDNATVE